MSSVAPTSAWLPSEAKRENPSPSGAAIKPSSSARLPLWEMSPMAPAGSGLGTSSSRRPESRTPRQLGPSSTAPALRTRAASAASWASRSSPPAPALMTTSARAPACSAASTVDAIAGPGTAMTTSSGDSGSSSRDA